MTDFKTGFIWNRYTIGDDVIFVDFDKAEKEGHVLVEQRPSGERWEVPEAFILEFARPAP